MSDEKRLDGVSSRRRHLALLALGTVLALCGGSARAAVFVVTNTNASGAGSLPDTVAQANGIAGTHTINITVTGTLTLTSAIGVGESMIINGPSGAPGFTIDGGGSAQLVVIQPITSSSGPVTMNNLTFSNGYSATSGGAIVVSAGTTLNVADCTFSLNTAVTAGGAIAVGNGATLGVLRSTFSINSATAATGSAVGGGAIWADTNSTVSVVNSMFAGNIATATLNDTGGGGINFHGASLLIQGSTFTGNYATGFLGGALLLFGTTGIENSTFVNNNASFSGGAIYVSAGSADIRNATITANAPNNEGVLCGGLAVASFGAPAPSASIRNTILTRNSGSPDKGSALDCVGPVTSNGYNILGDRNNGCNFGAHDIGSYAPQLGALGSNGGPTQTLVPLAGSPAIDAGDPAGCLALGGGVMVIDQRGLPRPVGPRCDIGAVEVQAGAATPPALTAAFNPVTITAGQTSTLTFTITNPAGSTSVSGIAFTNLLPAGVVLATAPAASQCGGVVVGTAGGGTFSLAAGMIATSPGTCTVAVSVTSTTPNTYQEGMSNVTGLANLSDVGLTASLTVLAASPVLTVSKAAPATIVAGQNLTYTITYGNPGASASPNVVIRDTIPVGTTFVSAANGGAVQGTDVVWSIASVAAGATNLTVSFTVSVAASATTVTNATYSIADAAGLSVPGSPVVVTAVTYPPSNVPALGTAGFALLVLGIAGAALVLLRTRV
jgi:uncharacterized repeat protein (TIGR01451 family)